MNTMDNFQDSQTFELHAWSLKVHGLMAMRTWTTSQTSPKLYLLIAFCGFPSSGKGVTSDKADRKGIEEAAK